MVFGLDTCGKGSGTHWDMPWKRMCRICLDGEARCTVKGPVCQAWQDRAWQNPGSWLPVGARLGWGTGYRSCSRSWGLDMIRLTHFAIPWRRLYRIWLDRGVGCTVGRACESEHEGLVLEESWRLVAEQG